MTYHNRDLLRHCPNCGSDQRGEEIPKGSRHMFRGKHFWRTIGISSIELDMVVRWHCPDCGHEWERR